MTHKIPFIFLDRPSVIVRVEDPIPSIYHFPLFYAEIPILGSSRETGVPVQYEIRIGVLRYNRHGQPSYVESEPL